MKDKKYYITLDDFERRVVVNCMNEMRNSLILRMVNAQMPWTKCYLRLFVRNKRNSK